MNQDQQADLIVTTVKQLLKKKNLKYQDLARHLGLSVAAVKRAMTVGEMPLSRLLAICELLEINLEEVLLLTKKEGASTFTFSKEQELFFAKHPSYLAFLFELYSGLTPQQIQQKHKISKPSRERYIKKLRSFQLVETDSSGKIKFLFKGVISWSDHGPIGSVVSKEMIYSFSKWATTKLTSPEQMFVRLSGWFLTKENYDDFKTEYQDLEKKYREISVYNKKVVPHQNCQIFSTMMIADAWEEEMFKKVTELKPQEP